MLIHGERSYIAYLTTFLLGATFAYVYIKNDNLYLSILLHTIWNLNITNSIFQYEGITDIEIFKVVLIVVVLIYSFKKYILQ